MQADFEGLGFELREERLGRRVLRELGVERLAVRLHDEARGGSHQGLLVFRDDFACPFHDASKFVDVRVTQGGELFGGLLAAVAAAAVDEDYLVEVGKLGRLHGGDALVGEADGAGDVAGGELVWASHVEDDVGVVAGHHLLGGLLVDLRVRLWGGG